MKKLSILLISSVIMHHATAQLGKMIANKVSAPTESTASKNLNGKIDIYSGSNKLSSTEIADGTDNIVLKCMIPSEAGSLKKVMGSDDFDYFFTIVIKNAQQKKSLINEVIERKGDYVKEWSTVVSNPGYLEFDFNHKLLLDFLKDENGILPTEQLTLEITLTTNRTKVIVCQSTVTFNCEGTNSKWLKADFNKIISDYKTGQLKETSFNDTWKRMVSYSKSHHTNAEIIHVKVISSSADSKTIGQTIYDIAVTILKDNEYMIVYVSVWEVNNSKSLEKYVPQHVENLPNEFSSYVSEIRNVK